MEGSYGDLSTADWSRRQERPRWLMLGLPLLFGIAGGLAAAAISALEAKFAMAGAVAMAAGVVWLCLPLRLKMLSAITFYVLGISLKMSKTIFLHEIGRGQFVPFAGGAAGLTISVNFLAALLILGVAIWRRHKAMRRPALRLQPLLMSGPALFMAAGLVSVINAQDPALTGFELIRQMMLLVGMVAAFNLERDELEFALRVLAVSILAQAAIAALQFITNAKLGLGFFGEQDLVEEQINFVEQTRAVGTIGHSNVLSYFFEITAPLMLALTLAAPKRIDRQLFLLTFAAAIGGMILTLSRAAWLTLPVAIPLVFLPLYGRRLWQMRTAVYAILLGIVLTAAAAAVYPLVAERLFSDDAGSASTRLPQIRAAISVIEQFPMVGVGLNNLGNALTRYDTTHYTRVFGPVNHVIHNLYLYVWAEVGTVGFLAFLWSFAVVFWVGRWCWLSADNWVRAVGLGGSVGLLAQMIHGGFDPGFRLSLPISSLIAFQIGLIGAAYLTDRLSLRFRPSMNPRTVWAERRQLN